MTLLLSNLQNPRGSYRGLQRRRKSILAISLEDFCDLPAQHSMLDFVFLSSLYHTVTTMEALMVINMNIFSSPTSYIIIINMIIFLPAFIYIIIVNVVSSITIFVIDAIN